MGYSGYESLQRIDCQELLTGRCIVWLN